MFSGKITKLVGSLLLLLQVLLLCGAGLAATDETRSRTAPNLLSADDWRSRQIIAATASPVENMRRAPSASAIRSIRITKDYKRGGLLLATIELDGQARYTHFTLPSPYRLVLDVQNVTTDVPPVIQVKMAELRRVRLGKMDDSVRVVFDAVKPQPYEINDEDSMIRIWFGEQKTAPAPETLAAEKQVKALSTLAADDTRPALKPPQPKPLSNTETTAKVHPPVPVASAPTLPGPHIVAKITRPRAGISAAPMRSAPTNQFALKGMDAPPPPRGRKPQLAPATTARMNPPVTDSAESTQPVMPRSSNMKSGGKVVRATPVPMTTPPATAMPTTTAAKPPAPAVTTDPAKPIVATNTPAPTPTPAPPTPRPREVTQSAGQGKAFNAADYNKPDFVGEPINLDLRSTQGKTVDIRDFLRFITDTYKVNFVIDQSVKDTPITVTLQNVPWNQAMDALLRANRLGIKVEGNILRVMSQETVALEDRIRQEQVRARQEATPLVTEMVRLNYARALTGAAGGSSGGGGGAGAGAAAGGGGGAMATGAGSTAGGSGLDGIIRTRLSTRGNIQADPRTNTLIITDLPENIVAIKEIIAKLDVPEPQVEIESRIVIANRNFARDLGIQLGATAINTSRDSRTTFSTLPGSQPIPAGTGPSDALRAAGAQSILSLTTGLIGTAQISAVLSAAETKGNVKTISSPRVTAQNNTTANIVNGVQIPVQTESNNTLTVTFVTAALRLEITPQINDNGNVLLKVVAENNSVNTAIATRSAPGINTQRAETTVLVPDGGTTIIGGINIDVESNSQQRTPGISRLPGLGELFKRRIVSRQTDEILFFITPRIYRPLNVNSVPQK